jgi:hypothetical protein
LLFPLRGGVLDVALGGSDMTSISKTVHRLWQPLAGLVLVTVTAGAGYAADPGTERLVIAPAVEAKTAMAVQTQEREPDELNPRPGDDDGGGCCSSGGYTCPGDPNISVDYDPPGCGPLTKPRAAGVCRYLCGGGCVDSGWQGGCQPGR